MREFTRRYYRKGPFPKHAQRNKALYYERQNEYEQRAVTPGKIRKQMRARLQEDRPELSATDIEEIIQRRLIRGMRPYRG